MVLSLFGLGCLLYAGLLFVRSRLALKDNQLKLEPRDDEPRIAVLVPARDESAVIEGLLADLQAQSVGLKPEDVYVIVESWRDPTVEICHRYHNTVVVRQNLTKQRKGYALDEALKQILKRRHYDLYFIFDADNAVSPDYVAKMLTSYRQGYQIVTGYRNAKNANDNVIAAVSSLTFSMINVLGNRKRIKYGANVIFSGTGCFIDGRLIDEWQGWPFQSLTEDYEMSLYATLHAIPTFYNEDAVFYDEQPTKYRQTVAQRVRWIKGYFAARHKYIPLMRARKPGNNYGSIVREIIGVRSAIWAIIGVILMLLGAAVRLFYVEKVGFDVTTIVSLVVLVYLVLMIATIVMIKREKLELKPRIKLGAVLFNPLYLITYIPCALKALLTKNVAWKKIEHGKK